MLLLKACTSPNVACACCPHFTEGCCMPSDIKRGMSKYTGFGHSSLSRNHIPRSSKLVERVTTCNTPSSNLLRRGLLHAHRCKTGANLAFAENVFCGCFLLVRVGQYLTYALSVDNPARGSYQKWPCRACTGLTMCFLNSCCLMYDPCVGDDTVHLL